jgi:hypothetical protein
MSSFVKKRGGRRRGAVFVEALIVSTTLALLLAAGVFVHALYANKLATLREARVAAWDGAVRGCGGALSAALLSGINTVAGLTDDGFGLLELPEWMGDAGRSAQQSAARSVQASALLTAGSRTLRTRRSIACNEYGDQSDDDSFLGALFQAVKDMVVPR